MSNELAPHKLRDMPAALVGGGEWAAAGLPKATHPARSQNALTAGVAPSAGVANKLIGMAPASVNPGVNLLAGGVAPSPASQPRMMISAPTAQPAPAVPPGQERHMAVGKELAVGKMSDADLKQRFARYEWVRNALGQALQKPGLTHDDMVQIVADGVREKALPAEHAAIILGSLPTAPADLRNAIQQRQLVATHGLVHMTAEQQHRAGAK